MYGAAALVAVAGAGAFFAWSERNPPIEADIAASQGISASVTELAKAHGGFIFHDSDKRLIDEDELKDLSQTELRVARNEIYARHGRFFVDQNLANYFSQFSWYHPGKVDVDLSGLETTNVNTLQTAEHRK
jgi:hypothetical protein